MIRVADQTQAELNETMVIVCDKLWQEFLVRCKEHYYSLRSCIHSLATLDCLMSLAKVAQRAGYVRPTLLPSDAPQAITIDDGRHPIIEQLLQDEPFVPNSTALTDECRTVVLTGPNMGGKSSYIRQVALIVVLAQLGSFVPARAVSISPVDRILVRMGAQDNVEQGRSTFLVEMLECSEALALVRTLDG